MFDEPGDGVPPGTYDVALRPPHPMDMSAEDSKLSPGPGWGLRGKYRSSHTSGITFNVDRTIKDAKIEIEKKASRAKR